MKRLGTIFLVLLFLVVAQTAFGAGGAQYDGVPFKVVYQAINFTLFVALLYYILRKPISAFFAQRVVAFREDFERAKRLKEEAEERNKDIKEKIKSMTETEDQQIEKAESEANALRARLLSEADELASQIQSDAKKMAELEYFKAQQELKREVIDQVLRTSREKIQTEITPQEQKTLKDKFLENVQAVQ